MFKGTGRSESARVDISFSFSRFSNQGVKCLSIDLPFVWLVLKLVQKRLCGSCQSTLRMALVAMNLIFWLSVLFSHLFESLSLKARNVLFKKLSYDVFVHRYTGGDGKTEALCVKVKREKFSFL